MKVIEKNGLRLREYPVIFEEQAVLRSLTVNAAVGKGSVGGIQAGIVPLEGSFEDSDNFYFLTVSRELCRFNVRAEMVRCIIGILLRRRFDEVDEEMR